ncbi:MAG: glycosyltransferase family 4 protein [Deltaproteobacteria bacterium]|nr:glycosyltransferase family 4 protein [Deltaproteobacteria bacterium]
MRITIVISSLGCGGAEALTALMANDWAERGNEVTILTFNSPSERPFFALHSAVRLLALNLAAPSTGWLQALKRNVERVSKLRAAIRDSAPDVVVSCMERMNVYTILATRRSGVPVVLSEHSVPNVQDPGRIWRLGRRWLYPLATRLIVQTEGARDYFAPWIGRVPVVIPNAFILPSAGESRGRVETFGRIGAAGRLSPEKGFDRLLDAFSLVAARHPTVTLTIWGEGPERGRLERQAQSLGIQAQVRFAGVVRPLLDAMKSIDMLAVTSRYEGFGNVLVEAMSAGIPVVSFDCPHGPRAIVRDGVDGILVPNGDLSAFAAALDRLILDPKFRAQLGSRAQEGVQRFGMRVVMPAWDAVLQDVVSRSSDYECERTSSDRRPGDSSRA